MAKVKVTVTKQAYNSAMLGARTLKRRRDISSEDDPEGKGHGQGHNDL